MSTMKLVGISGSLRQNSFNSAALRAAQALMPAGSSLDIVTVGDLPLYNDDVRASGYPPEVEAFRARLRSADAVLLVSPEYNYSISGVLKNAIDWASRAPDQPFDGKVVGIMGASAGLLGTARAQYHLRQMLVFLNAFTVNKPEVMIGQAAQKFNDAMELTDEPTRDHIRRLLVAMTEWTVKLKGPGVSPRMV